MGLLALIAFFIAMKFLPFDRWMESFREMLDEAGAAAFLIFIAVGIVAVLLFVPVSVPVTAAGLFFGFAGGLLPAFAVLAAGASGGFFVGRFLWPKINHFSLFKGSVFKAVRKALEHDGNVLLALLRMTPFMHYMTSNIFFGSLDIRFGPYILSSLLGMIPGTLLLVYGGSVASSAFGSDEGVSFWQWVLFGVGLLLFALISWRVSIKTRRILKNENKS